LKTALIKQAHDLFGPWSGVLWKDTSPTKLFDVWPGKAVYWELTCMLQADWFIIPQSTDTDYTRDAVAKHPGRAAIIEKHTSNVTPQERIPFGDYDLVISFDAILNVPANSRTVFAYFAQEHWDRLYGESLRRPAKGYDLFLAHMLDSLTTIQSLPQSISFPYTHDLVLSRSTFPEQKQNVVWVDWRTLMTLSMRGFSDPWDFAAENATIRLAETLGLSVTQRGIHHTQSYGFADPPAWGDAASYLRDLARSRYYVGVGNIAGAGQGLAEAAAMGCLCVGQSDKAYHRLICHPECLCEDLAEMPQRFRKVVASDRLQREALAAQDRALEIHFASAPIKLLHEAVRLKQENQRH